MLRAAAFRWCAAAASMCEVFVNALRCDYLDGADRITAARVLEQIPS